MSTGYTRQDTSNNISNGSVIDADDLDLEFNAVEAAFNSSSGHTHDGSSGQGAPITKVGPAQDVLVSSTAVLPKASNTLDIGSSTAKFKDFYLDGVAYLDAAVVTSADISGGTIGGVTLATSNITVGPGKTLDVSAGTLTLAANQISGDKVEGGTIDAITINTLTNTTLTNTTSNTATVNSTTVNATTVDTTNLEVTNLKSKNGASAGSIADSTGVVTLNSLVATTADVNGGTIDGTSIGASVASTGVFTTLSTSGLATLSSLSTASATITGGSISGITDLAVADGGTGSSTAAGALVNLGLTATAAEINTLDGITASVTELNYVDGVTSSIQTQLNAKQPLDAELTAIAALSVTDSNFIVGNGTTWVAESGTTARTSLGLGTISTQSAASVAITGGSITGITDLAVADGGTGSSTAAGALVNLGLTATASELNTLDGITASVVELNILDGVTTTTAELNYVDGVTSAIQTQLNAKQPLDATLTALAGLATGANKIPMASGTDTFTQVDFKDEDNMVSNSDTAVPSQQSTKAYVDATVGAWEVAQTLLNGTSASTSLTTNDFADGYEYRLMFYDVTSSAVGQWLLAVTFENANVSPTFNLTNVSTASTADDLWAYADFPLARFASYAHSVVCGGEEDANLATTACAVFDISSKQRQYVISTTTQTKVKSVTVSNGGGTFTAGTIYLLRRKIHNV